MSFSKIKNIVISVLLVCATSVFIFASAPQSAQAQWLVSAPIQEALTAAKNIWDKIQKQLDKINKQTGSRAFNQAIRRVTYKLAQDTATFVASGGKGKKPLLFTSPEKFLRESGDQVAGEFLAKLTESFPVDLCSANSIKSKLAINIGLSKYLRGIKYAPFNSNLGKTACKLSDITNNFAEAAKAKNFLVDFSSTFEPGKNDISSSATLFEEAKLEKQRKEAAEIIRRNQTNDSKALEDLITNNPQTPRELIIAAQVEAQRQALNPPPRTEDIWADTLAVFTNTLKQKLLQRLASGYYPFRKSNNSPDSSDLAGSAGSIKALLSSFDVFSPERAAKVSTTGEVDLFSEIISCPPPQYQSPYNCLLNDGLQQAIQQGLTVQQALAKGLLDADSPFPQVHDPKEPNLSLANLRKLRFLRVLPVGWELAAAKLQTQQKKITLGEVIKCFSAPIPASPPPPAPPVVDSCAGLRGLMDPAWALALPQTYCRAEGIGNVPENEQSSSRQRWCVDLQSCIKEDAKGNCQAYGYCTRERALWKLQGEECSQQYATCQVLRRPDGSTVGTAATPGILGSDIDKNGCTQANAGCTWFSKTRTGNNTWDANSRVYLTASAASCRAEDSGSREIIPLEPGTNLIRNNQSGQRVDIKPYIYYTLSFDVDIQAPARIWVDGAGISNVSFSSLVNNSAILDLPGNSLGRYAATFFSQGAGNATISFNNSQGFTRMQLEEVSLLDGKRAQDAFTANSGAGIAVLNSSPPGSRNPAAPATAYKLYQDNRKLVFAGANECRADEASARKYTPLKGGATQVARLLAGDLCPAACVGLDSYLAMPTKLESFSNTAGDYPKRQSFIAQYGQSCNAAEVGCEEFTNVAPVPGSAEKREYYSQVRSCVLDTNPQAVTFYTWQGTDTAGFQLKSWHLLAETDAQGRVGGPCNDFPQGSQADPGSSTTRCSAVAPSCAVSSANPNCRVFLDETGREYKRDMTKIVTASKECTGYRRSVDGQTWYFLAKESQQCTAANVGCREYKGGRANLVRNVLVSNFEKGDEGGWDHGEAGGESYNPGGGSYQITPGDDGNISYNFSDGTASFVGKTYLLSFDAKASAASAMIDIIRFKVDGGDGPQERRFVNVDNPLPINNDWVHYQVGPVFYASMGQTYDNILPQLLIRAQGAAVYIDNIKLSEVQDNIYLKTDSWLAKQPAECSAYNQCEAYKDDNNNTFYTSRFAKLFGPDSAYCRAVIDTQNSDKPEGAVFNQDNANDNPDDNYSVAADKLEYRIIKPENLRPVSAAGCTALGVPNDTANPTAWTGPAYRVIDPDAFKQGALCRAEGLGCQNFKNNGGQSFVFRDPGNKLCVWSQQLNGFVRQNPDGTPTDIDCYVGLPADEAGWVAQCPAEQSSCTAYVPTDANYTEGAATALFMKKDTVEAGDCQAGDSIDSGCVNFREGYIDIHDPLRPADIRGDLLVDQQTRLLAVKPGRTCAQWLAPTTTSEVADPQTRNKRTVVYALGSCQAIASDGKCTQWANQEPAVLDAALYQDRNKGAFAGKNIFSGAWDYSGYSIPGKAQVNLLGLDDMTAACRSYPEEDAPFSSSGLDVDPKTGTFIYIDNVLKNVNKCEPGENCECSYKKVDSTEQGAKYYATSTASVLPETTKSITNLNGWRGYCLEADSSKRDPNNNPVCVNWWPVDVPSTGVNIFDNHPEAGFNLAGPLYYCAQAKGNKLNDEGADWRFKLQSQGVISNNYLIKVGDDQNRNNGYANDGDPTSGNIAILEMNIGHEHDDKKDNKIRVRPLALRAKFSGRLNYDKDDNDELEIYTLPYDCKLDNTRQCILDSIKRKDYKVDKGGWSAASGILPFPINASSPLDKLHEYDIEKIILVKKNGTGFDYGDWPTVNDKIVLQRDGWANNGETTEDRWTALWCNGDKCNFGKGGYSWGNFVPFMTDIGEQVQDDYGVAVAGSEEACTNFGGTNLLGMRAVFAQADGSVPEDFWKRIKAFQSAYTDGDSSEDFDILAWNWNLSTNETHKLTPYQLLGFEAGLCDGSKAQGGVDFDIYIQLREWCSVVAKVDGNGDNKAWTGRLNQKSITSFPRDKSVYDPVKNDNKGALTNLYIQQNGGFWDAYLSQDSSPFGSIVPPAATIYHPDQWDSRKDQEDEDPTAPQAEPKLLEPGQQPLYVEAGRKQVRAGTPYSCAGDACVLPPTDKGIKIKPEGRIDRNEERLDKAKNYLLQLFGKIQSLWSWNTGGVSADGVVTPPGYQEDKSASGLDLLANAGECPVIQAIDPEAGHNNTQTGNCLFKEGYGGNYSINNQAIKPNGLIKVNRGEPVNLQFYAYNQNGEQLPLTRIQIDWGNQKDQPADVTTINGSFKNHKPDCPVVSPNYGDTAKACAPEYFQFQHVYQVEGSYKPKIVITDNWGRQTEATYSYNVLQVEKAQPQVASTIGAAATGAACTEDTWTYSDYGACSADGKQTRTATINFNCPNVTTPPALSKDCTNGGWGPWRPPVGVGYPDGNTPAGTCSTACGRGQQVRRCNAPPPANGGSECLLQDGSTRGMQETRACNTQACPINGGWGDWSACSAACGGQQFRSCNKPGPEHNGLACLFENGITRGIQETRLCSTPACDADRDGVTVATDCDDKDPNAYPGSTRRSTTSKDMNCNGKIESSQIICLDPKTGTVNTTTALCENLANARRLCSSRYPGSTVAEAGGRANCYSSGSQKINSCSWCARSGREYW